ncbi:MAG TPA: hypothetical protein VGG06_25095 [Thermoanaerobaculia bacterium]|jgi:hypothetical protein
MVKKLKSVLLALVLAALSGTVFAGGNSLWPYGLQDDPPTVGTFVAGGLPLGVFIHR